MPRMPDPPEGFESDMAFDDESIPLWVRIDEALRMVLIAQKAAKHRGITWARCEAEYYTAKAEESFGLYEDGTPATVIAQVAKGMPRTNAALERRLAEEVGYKNAVEAIQCYKLIARLLNDEQQREWEQAKRTT
jgi:hypothetical protein